MTGRPERNQATSHLG